jgi:hypothetical protein
VVETFFKTIKAELIWRHTWQTRRQVHTALFQYINGFCNPRRRHSTIPLHLAPVQYDAVSKFRHSYVSSMSCLFVSGG